MLFPRITGPLALTLALGTAAPAAAADTRDQDRKILIEMEAKLEKAVASKHVDDFIRFWVDDAAVFPAGQPIATGRTGVLAEWKSILDDAAATLTWKPERAEVAGSRDLGYTFGLYRYTT